MHCRADIVNEAWQSELSGPRTAADGRLSLDYRRAKPCLGQNNGRRQTVGAGADDKRFLPRFPRFVANVCIPLPAILAAPAFREMDPPAMRPQESTASRTAVSTTARFEPAPPGS